MSVTSGRLMVIETPESLMGKRPSEQLLLGWGLLANYLSGFGFLQVIFLLLSQMSKSGGFSIISCNRLEPYGMLLLPWLLYRCGVEKTPACVETHLERRWLKAHLQVWSFLDQPDVSSGASLKCWERLSSGSFCPFNGSFHFRIFFKITK